jgi:uncharacterized protein YvpB
MKKILVILSATLLSACTNYGYVRQEESYITATPLNNSSNIILIQRTYPDPYLYYDNYYYYHEHNHNHGKPNDSHQKPPPSPPPAPPHDEKPHKEPFKPFFKTR